MSLESADMDAFVEHNFLRGDDVCSCDLCERIRGELVDKLLAGRTSTMTMRGCPMPADAKKISTRKRCEVCGGRPPRCCWSAWEVWNLRRINKLLRQQQLARIRDISRGRTVKDGGKPDAEG